MRLFAAVADAGGFTAASRRLGLPKQTLSRRIAELEETLGVRLLHRTTRTLRLTDLGVAYAARCTEVVRLADEANDALTHVSDDVRGALRVTADPLFGEAFLADLVREFVEAHPAVEVELMLTSRRVDLIEEGFDLAFRVGELRDSSLMATRLGPAAMRYCAAPGYLAARGVPTTPDELAGHDCIALMPDGAALRWLFVEDGAPRWRPVTGRVRVNHLPTARRLAESGLGVVNLPAFACVEELAAGRLVSVLDDYLAPFGAIHLVYPGPRLLAPRVRRFIDAAITRFREDAALG